MTPIDHDAIKGIQEALLGWYDKNARSLPWRSRATPYNVWVSEIMLQQTRVETVIPYFDRFIKEIPDIERLASVPDEKLFKLWEGLGYYSRARNLKKAASVIMNKFGGVLPSDIRDLKSLPGIGPYSAGAIASIAFQSRECAVDGNVRRVAARLLNRADAAEKSAQKETEAFVLGLVPLNRPGDFNQALMELGAVVCVPNAAPMCGMCPVSRFCEGYMQGTAPDIPSKAIKQKKKKQLKTVLVIKAEDRIALRKRPAEGILSELWELPNVPGHLSPEECARLTEELGLDVIKFNVLKPYKHIFTHLEWMISGFYIQAQSLRDITGWVWATREEIRELYSIPAAFNHYLNNQ